MHKVVLADGDDMFRFMRGELSSELVHRFDTVASGSECVDRIFHDPRDHPLVLMDIRMPVQSGPDTARRVWHDVPKLSTFLPIVAMAGDTGWRGRKRATKAGFCGVLIMPIPGQRLTSFLDASG